MDSSNVVTQLHCPGDERAKLLEAGVDVNGTNGIDHVEVIDDDAPPGTSPQRTLVVHCFRSAAGITAANVRIEGGVRTTGIAVEWAHPIPELPSDLLEPAEAELAAVLAARENAARQVVVRVSRPGDFSPYRVRLVRSPREDDQPDGFDPIHSSAAFSFKVDCPGQACAPDDDCREAHPVAPRISYLAKDYASFRRLLMDRLSVLMPEWRELSAADLLVTLVELLAYRGDELSYYQDAVAAEAYLDTARLRTSVRRHARLVGYRLHEGANARAWLVFDVGAGGDGRTLVKGTVVRSGARDDRPSADDRAGSPPVTFETMHDLALSRARSTIQVYTWRDPDCCLPRGATAATLEGSTAALGLRSGDLLLFEEVLGADSGRPEDADPTHRHVVRLSTDPVESVDPTNDLAVLEVRWHDKDALPFPLCLRQHVDPEGETRSVGVARGNVALADHGRTVTEEITVASSRPGRARAALGETDLTFAVPFDPDAARHRPAADAVRVAASDSLPVVRLFGEADEWTARYDLLASDRFAPHFVVEPADDRTAYLRFGDGVHGRLPTHGTSFGARYRTGGGTAGNVGADILVRLDVDDPIEDVAVRNPLPASGGRGPQPAEEARLYAPQAFRTQQRAVTPEDYARIASRHPEVQRAVATRRWTGSWHTWFLTVDRVDGRPIDPAFEQELRGFMDRFRLAGYDLEIDAPRLVPLDIELRVCVEATARPDAVSAALFHRYSARGLRDGTRGFFHPDRWTFGQSVYVSEIIDVAMRLPGVHWVQPVRFRRFARDAAGELEAGRIDLGRLEVAQVQNDPVSPERGRIAFTLEGGR